MNLIFEGPICYFLEVFMFHLKCELYVMYASQTYVTKIVNIYILSFNNYKTIELIKLIKQLKFNV